jgi:hypothetical protein
VGRYQRRVGDVLLALWCFCGGGGSWREDFFRRAIAIEIVGLIRLD